MLTRGRIELDSRDYDLLVSLVEYVILRYEELDSAMVGYLTEGLNTVRMHVSAECNADDTMDQISDILRIIDDSDISVTSESE